MTGGGFGGCTISLVQQATPSEFEFRTERHRLRADDRKETGHLYFPASDGVREALE